MILRFNRDTTGLSLSGLGLLGLLGLVGLLALAPAVGAANTTSILDVTADGTHMSVNVELSGALDPTVPLTLRLLSDAGIAVDSKTVLPPAGGGHMAITLAGEFLGLSDRGLQHRLELSDGGGILDNMDVRFGVDCSTTPCTVVAAPHVYIDGALSIDAALAPYLNGLASTDLGALAQSYPALAGAAFETSVDLAGQPGGRGCRCFFTADVGGGGMPRAVISGRWESATDELVLYARWSLVEQTATSLVVDHETYKEATLDFRCFKVSQGGTQLVATNAGLLETPTSTLTPCASACLPTVSWSAEPYWAAYVDTHIDVVSSVSFDATWEVDGAEVYQDGRSWTLSGAQYQPYQPSSPGQTGVSVNAGQVPSSMRFGGTAAASVTGVSEYDRPQLEVAAGAVLHGQGRARCAKDATLNLQTMELGAGMTPATLAVVLGTDEDP